MLSRLKKNMKKNMKKNSDSLLDNAVIASPCSMKWDSMIGGDRERSCSGCSRTIYNISDMTKTEAEAFLRKSGSAECVTFYRRQDGTIMTDDCPRALRRLRDRCRFAVKVAAGFLAFVLSIPAALAQPSPSRNVTGSSVNLEKPFVVKPVPPVLPTKPFTMMLGGIPAFPRGKIRIMDRPLVTPTDATIAGTSGTTASVQATIVTKEHTLPDGKTVHLVTQDADGKVIQFNPDGKNDSKESNDMRSSKIEELDHNVTANKLIDTRANDLFSKALEAQSERKYELAEFYLLKTLDAFDQQKDADPIFRKYIESELSKVQLQLQSSQK